ncbi:MAG: SDR family oxidoreductase [Rhodoferax sp.]|nr:SDR family oxidoreductase [Rhodoferax sp.]
MSEKVVQPGPTHPLPMPAWLSLAGKTAVVTGGGTHLGQAMALALAELGASVHLVGRRGAVVDAAAHALCAQGHGAWSHAADAADPEAMTAVVADVVRRHGQLDVMVCNAGGGQGADMAPNIRLEDLEATLRGNVGTTMVSAQAAAQVMMPRAQGAIVTVGSIHGTLGSDPRLYGPGFRRSSQSYHAAKGAVVNLTRALACEWAQHGLTVNCISPGQIPKASIDPVTRSRFLADVPLGRLGEPADLKGAIALFASPAGRWITGQNLVVDGGWSAW